MRNPSNSSSVILDFISIIFQGIYMTKKVKSSKMWKLTSEESTFGEQIQSISIRLNEGTVYAKPEYLIFISCPRKASNNNR
mmetsp:Transcript_32913/g.37342  ORF Transcript_32913/g.37342 Transcript_32913/m.37342 type:complete len:81 (-) Transcript_32913:699-941(-)